MKKVLLKPLDKKLPDFPISLVRKTASDFNKAFHSKLFTLVAASESELWAFSRKFEPHYSYCFGFQTGEDGQWFLDWEGVLRVRNWIVEAIKLRGSQAIFSVHEMWQKDWGEYGKTLESITRTDLARLSDLDFYKQFEKFYVGYLSAGGVAYMADTFMSTGETDWLEDILSKEISLKIPSDKVKEAVRIVTNPFTDSYTIEAEWKLIEIGAEMEKFYAGKLPSLQVLKKEHLPIFNLLNEHTRSYFWINNNYFNVEALDTQFFYNELRKKFNDAKNLGVSFSETLQKRKKEREILKTEQENLILKLNLPVFVGDLLKVSWLFAEWKDIRKKGSYIGMHYFDLFLNELSRRTSYSKKDLTFLIFQEVRPLLFEKFDFRKIIAGRRMKTFYAVTPEGYFITGGDSAKRFFDAGKKEYKETSELKGVSACRGVANGKVRIVRNTNEMKSFLRGEILVTNQTTPEFVPIMRKAGAIVTEQGGITSHAAIISRELKIPCVIGTKIATKILKDGDLVEVDANAGVVRILDKK